MHHDKKTTLRHQDILIRRGFNIPAAGVVEETTGDEIINDHSAQPAAEIKPKPKSKKKA